MYKGKLVFATNNANKIIEANRLLEGVNIVSLKEIECFEELPETHETLEENALEKAQYVYDHFKVNCFAEDTGLEVVALGNQPGVYSARYAGPQRNTEDNIDLLLKNLENESSRTARFRTIIALIINGMVYQFEGIANGVILPVRKGDDGFGYDPVFQPDGYEESFAELTIEEKNKISHRGNAVKKLVSFLQSYDK